MAAMLLASCNALEGDQDDSRMPIRLTTSIAPTTRANTQDVQLLAGEKVYLWANEEATAGTTDWSANPYIKAWTLTANGSGVLTHTNDYYYPARPLSMVAIHGNFTYSETTDAVPTSGVSHSIETNQSTLANYAKSDLLYWAADNKTHTGSNVTLQFAHKLSKVEITLSSSEYSAAELNRAVVTLTDIQPTVSMTIANDRTATVGTPTGSASVITPYKPSASTAYYEAIVPCGQQKPAAFISVTMNGQTFTVNPDKPADAANFLENKKYAYTLTLSRTGITVTSNITDWTPVAGTAATNVGPKNLDIRKNPLWYMAQYNVADEKGTTFATTANAGYYFTWEDAMRNFCYVGGTTYSNTASGGSQTTYAGTVGAECNIPGYHMPILKEWNSVLPLRNTSDEGIDLFNVVGEVGASGNYSYTTEVCFGYNDVTRGTGGVYMTELSYWYKKSATEFYAIRYCDSEYCSIWKYEWADNGLTIDDPGTFTITSRLLGEKLSVADAASTYGTTEANWTAPFSGLTFDVNGNDETHNAVQRTITARGRGTSSGNTPTHDAGTRVFSYACTEKPTAPGTEAYGLWIYNAYIAMGGGTKTYSRNIRLFRNGDESKPEASLRKTTVAEATTSQLVVGDIVCSDGSIFAASQAAAVAAEGRTPVGIIAFVNDGTAIGNAATENGRGRYTVKSRGRALVLGLKNASEASDNIKWKTDATPFRNLWTIEDVYFELSSNYMGFERTQAMNSATYPACQTAYNYTGLPAPAYSTGWFLPSAGQWKKIVAGFTDYKNLNQDQYWSATNGNPGSSTTYTMAYIGGQINDYLSLAGTGNYDALNLSAARIDFWSSSEYRHVDNVTYASCLYLNPDAAKGIIEGFFAYNSDGKAVRPVFAF